MHFGVIFTAQLSFDMFGHFWCFTIIWSSLKGSFIIVSS